MKKPKLFVSFSGGKTSGYMLRKYIDSGEEFTAVFANTGLEREETLQFVHNIETQWNVPIVWLEAVTHLGEVKGCTHRIVSYETASRNGEPFAQAAAKYGLPGQRNRYCTRELKINAIRSLVRKSECGSWQQAIGIRADEPDRVSVDKSGCIYPLFNRWPTTKSEVNNFWEDQSFTLNLREHEGNCSTCFQKSDRKLYTIAKERPQDFAFFANLESKYSEVKCKPGERNFIFRNYRTTSDILAAASLLQPDTRRFNREDENSGCSESCEAY